MIDLIKNRLEGLQRLLMSVHAAGHGMPDPSVGSEREIVVREFLARIMPPGYRIGTGAIIDASGRRTGQLDLVIEWPIGPSLPVLGDTRLYLAESVAAVIEVKSNFYKQWTDVLGKAAEVRPLVRSWLGCEHVSRTGTANRIGSTKSRIPVLAIGFEGWTSGVKVREKLLEPIEEKRCVDSAFVIDSGAFSSLLRDEGVDGGVEPRGVEGAEGYLRFLEELSYWLQNIRWAVPDIGGYSEDNSGQASTPDSP